MGKNSDIESASNSLSKTILHEILVDYTNRKESVPKLKKEAVEYRNQSLKKINRLNLNDEDKRLIRKKVIKKIQDDLKQKYADVSVPKEVIVDKVNEEIGSFS